MDPNQLPRDRTDMKELGKAALFIFVILPIILSIIAVIFDRPWLDGVVWPW